MKRTKIICTIGPSSSDEHTLEEMIKAGMNVARLNFSHGTHEEHLAKIETIKRVRERMKQPVPIMLDTKGPEYRIRTFKNGKIELKPGDSFIFTSDDIEGDETKVSVSYKNLPHELYTGDTILLNNGLMEFRVDVAEGNNVHTTVVVGGTLSDRKSMSFPGKVFKQEYLSEQDKKDLLFGIENDVDFVACSFVSVREDVDVVRRFLDENGGNNIDIIAKIENSTGVENIEAIIEASDGIMVARGDLGAEVPMENIPVIQKQLISKCYNAGKQVITATQMLESMTHNPRPTRAEITDVANAIYDGTSATMLSGETAMGEYPIEAVRRMATIALRTESDIDYKKRFFDCRFGGFGNVTDAISHATCTTAHDLGAKAIITVTVSGFTARLLSRFRPQTDIIACSPDPKACRHMNMSWGVIPMLIDKVEESSEKLLSTAVDNVYRAGYVNYGDLVVVTAGLPLGIPGTTNMLKVQMVGDVLLAGKGIVEQSVCGQLCVCTNEDEALEKGRSGDIIVVPFASDRIISVLRHASAIICERGGDDSYAAIVGKTLNIPVIIAENATKILKSGTTVTVDGRELTFEKSEVALVRLRVEF